MQAEADGAVDGRAEAGSLVQVRALGRQVEDIGSQLHGRVALRTAAGDTQALDARAGALLDLLAALAQGVGQALEDGTVEVRAGMHVAEADDRALGLQPRLADARRPERLQHQAHGARRHALHQFVEQGLGLHPQLQAALALDVAELLLEPADHPEAAKHHDLGVVVVGNRRRVRRDQRDGLQVLGPRGVDGRRGAVGQAGRTRLHAAGADHLAGLVRGGGDQRQALGNAGMSTGLGADRADALTRLDQLRQHVRAHRNRLPLPVAGFGPAQALVVERQVGHAAAHRVGEAAAQAMGEKAREQQELVRARPDLRLLLGDPAGFGLAAEVVDGLLFADQLEQPAPGSLDAACDFGPALVEPENGRAQRLAGRIDIDQGAALGGQRHTGNLAFIDVDAGPQLPAGLAEAAPVVLRVLLGPAGMLGIVGFQLHLALADQVAGQVEEQRAHALGAVVDGQQIALFAHEDSPGRL